MYIVSKPGKGRFENTRFYVIESHEVIQGDDLINVAGLKVGGKILHITDDFDEACRVLDKKVK